MYEFNQNRTNDEVKIDPLVLVAFDKERIMIPERLVLGKSVV